MKWLVGVVLGVLLTLPCFGAVEIAYDSADSLAMLNGSTSATNFWAKPYANRLWEDGTVFATSEKVVTFPAMVPRGQPISVAGFPVVGGNVLTPIFDTSDGTPTGTMKSPLIMLLGIDSTRSKILGWATTKIYHGTIDTDHIDWVEVLDWSTPDTVPFTSGSRQYNTTFARYPSCAKVIGDRITLWFYNGTTAQGGAGEDDDLGRVYTGTWNSGSGRFDSFTCPLSMNGGGPATPGSVAASGNCFAFGTYCQKTDSIVVGYYYSADAGVTWTDVAQIKRTHNDDYGHIIHCHGCAFGENTNEFFAAHGDWSAPLRRFNYVNGAWSWTEEETTPGVLTSKVSGLHSDTTTLTTKDQLFYDSELQMEGSRIVIKTTPEQVRMVANKTIGNYTSVTLNAAITAADDTAVELSVPGSVGISHVVYSGRRIWGNQHTPFTYHYGSWPDVLSWGRDDSWEFRGSLYVPDYNARVGSRYNWGYTRNDQALALVDGTMYAGVVAYGAGTNAMKTGYGVYVSPDGEVWCDVLRASYEAPTTGIIFVGVMDVVGTLGNYTVCSGRQFHNNDPADHTGWVVLVPKVTTKKVTGFVVQKGGENSLAYGAAADADHWSLENATSTLAANNWVLYYPIGDGGSAIDVSSTSALHGSKSMRWYVANGATDTEAGGNCSGTAIRVSAIAHSPALEEWVSLIWWQRALNLQSVTQWGYLWNYATADTELQKAYTWSTFGATDNWRPCIQNFRGHAATAYRWEFYASRLAGWEGKESTLFTDCHSAIFDQYRQWSLEYLPYRSGAVAADAQWGDEWVWLPMPSTTTSWTLTFDWIPLKASQELHENIPVITLRGSTGNYTEIGWIAEDADSGSSNDFGATFLHDHSDKSWTNDQWNGRTLYTALGSATLASYPITDTVAPDQLVVTGTVTGSGYIPYWISKPNAACFYAKDDTTTKVGSTADNFHHYDDTKFALTCNAGAPTILWIWDPKSGWQSIDLDAVTALKSLGRLVSVELGTNASHAASAGDYAAIGCGRYANVRLHTGALTDAECKAATMDITAKVGTRQTQLRFLSGLYINPPLR